MGDVICGVTVLPWLVALVFWLLVGYIGGRAHALILRRRAEEALKDRVAAAELKADALWHRVVDLQAQLGRKP